MNLFATEAALCDAFMAWARAQGYRVFPETAGWDMVLVDKDGFQIGVEAKKQLNLKVLQQVLSGTHWLSWRDVGPDHRAVLVPSHRGLDEVLAMVGVTVFDVSNNDGTSFRAHGGAMFDWNPIERLSLPPVEFSGAAGVPAPSGMTPWKLGAIRLIAILETRGFLTRRDFEAVRMSPTRWMSHDHWLTPGAARGQWVRGELPRFEERCPEVYVHVLAEVQAKEAA